MSTWSVEDPSWLWHHQFEKLQREIGEKEEETERYEEELDSIADALEALGCEVDRVGCRITSCPWGTPKTLFRFGPALPTVREVEQF